MAPKAYCKFRTQCVIWALEHDRDGDLLQPDESGKDPERERIEAELEKARQELDEAEKRIPAHSVRPNQVMELEEIEQRIEELERQLGSTGAAP